MFEQGFRFHLNHCSETLYPLLEEMKSSSGVKGLIFNIQRYCVHDGPGIRTAVFFKGCPLQCPWCCNPESHLSSPEIMHNRNRCVGCGRCIEVCPKRAIVLNETGISTDRILCDGCGRCIEVCVSEAREMAGKFFTVREVLEVVEKDTLFYRNSGGGVTLSGGEPFMQPLFAKTLLQLCQESGFHTAVETCGAVPWENIAQSLEFVDLFLYDIKHINPLLHRRIIGGTNRLVLDNLRRIVKKGIETTLRVPVIPGFNATLEEIGAIADMAKTLEGIKEINLLPYHRLGKQKYERLERPYTWIEDTLPEELMEELLEVVRSKGLEGSVG